MGIEKLAEIARFEMKDGGSIAGITEVKYNALKVCKLSFELLGEKILQVIINILNGGIY